MSDVDPYLACNFQVYVGGEQVARFTEVRGLRAEVATVEYREGGYLAGVARQIPTVTKFHDVRLLYGLSPSTLLWDWFCGTIQGQVERRNVSIMLMNAGQSETVAQWNLLNAFPKAWNGALLSALPGEVAIEEIVLAYDSLGKSES